MWRILVVLDCGVCQQSNNEDYYYHYLNNTPVSIDPRGKKRKKSLKTNVEGLEVRIVVQNECFSIKSRIEALNGD